MTPEGCEGWCVPHRPDWERKGENSKKEEGTEDTKQTQSWRGGKIMEASDGYVFGKREKQRKFY